MGKKSSTWVAVFDKSHLDGIIPRYIEDRLFKLLPEKTVDYVFGKNPGFTLMSEGGPVGAGGIHIPWEGLGEAWAFAGPRVYKHPKAFHSAVKAGMRMIARSFRLRRVECLVDAKFAESMKWVERLGFEPESALPKFGPDGGTFIRFVWFPDVDSL